MDWWGVRLMFSTYPRAHGALSTYSLLSLSYFSHMEEIYFVATWLPWFLIAFQGKHLLLLHNTRLSARSFMLLTSSSVYSRLGSLHITFRVSLTGQEVPAEAEHRPNSLHFPWHKSYQYFRNYYQKIKIKPLIHILSSFLHDLKDYLEQKILTHPLCIWRRGNSVLILILQPGSLGSNHKVYHWFAVNRQWVTSAHFLVCCNRMNGCTYFIGFLWGLNWINLDKALGTKPIAQYILFKYLLL